MADDYDMAGDYDVYDDQANDVYDDQAYDVYDDQAYDDAYMEEKVCKVYDVDDAFTAFVQILLALLALFSLYIKRQNEVPRRKFMTWWLDVSKQGFGAFYAHVLNMIIAAIISGNVRGEFTLEDQCAWYAINYFVDTTLGLFFSVVILQMFLKAAREYEWETVMNSGVYEGPDAMTHWFHQLLAWLGILTIVKVILLSILWLFSPLLAKLGAFLFQPFQSNIHFELLFVMMILPGVLNVFYFWVADGYLKAEEEHTCSYEICCSLCEDEETLKLKQEAEEPQSNYVSMDKNAVKKETMEREENQNTVV